MPELMTAIPVEAEVSCPVPPDEAANGVLGKLSVPPMVALLETVRAVVEA